LPLGFQVHYTVLLDLSVGSRMDPHIVWITHHTKQVQYMEPQEDHIFLSWISL